MDEASFWIKGATIADMYVVAIATTCAFLVSLLGEQFSSTVLMILRSIPVRNISWGWRVLMNVCTKTNF